MGNELMKMDKEVRVTSLELVEVINEFRKQESEINGNKYTEKRHSDLMAKLRKIELNTHIKLEVNTYCDSQGKKRPCYLLSRNDISILVSTYRDNEFITIGSQLIKYFDLNIKHVSIERKETNFGKMLKIMFPRANIFQQFIIGKHRIDWYMECGGLLIEYDEVHGCHNKIKDKEREAQIYTNIMNKINNDGYLYSKDEDWFCNKSKLNIEDIKSSFRFIRIKEGCEIEGLKEIMDFQVNYRMIECLI